MTDLTNRITRSGVRARSRSTFPLGRWQVRRSGYGAMQLAGPWADNPPEDRPAAIGLLRAAVTAGVDHIDTAQYYGPDIVNDLIREALYPYPPQLAVVSKVGVFRDTGQDSRQLRQGIEDNLRSLRASQLAAVNLRLPSPTGPAGMPAPGHRLRAVLPARPATRRGLLQDPRSCGELLVALEALRRLPEPAGGFA